MKNAENLDAKELIEVPLIFPEIACSNTVLNYVRI
jgi:hypothetical protein